MIGKRKNGVPSEDLQARSAEFNEDDFFTPEEIYLMKRRDILINSIMDQCYDCDEYLCLHHMEWLEPLLEDLNKVGQFEKEVFG